MPSRTSAQALVRDATEALALAEQHEREVEVDSEAWKLLLDQMRESSRQSPSQVRCRQKGTFDL